MMKNEDAKPNILSQEFTQQAAAAWALGRKEALAHGVAVFYRDMESGLEVMEQPDGRRFEIRFKPGAGRGKNYEVIRELTAHAA
jgi:hypothetical protein